MTHGPSAPATLKQAEALDGPVARAAGIAPRPITTGGGIALLVTQLRF